jgi:alkyldihydroxyacetonephosphate synthase
MTSLVQAIRAHVPLACSEPLDLLAASRDLWSRDTLRLARGDVPSRPTAVCWPESPDQVLDLLRWATSRGVSIVPYGGGSGVCGGATGREDTVVVDLKRMRAIRQVNAEQATVEVEPGIVGQILEDRLQERGLTLGHSPSSIWCSTVGGWAATRSAGQFSSYFGKFEDMVLGLTVATPAGEVATGVWAPPGSEDLQPCILGSEGTLGVITRLLVRVAPVPERRWYRGYAFGTQRDALQVMRDLMQAELWPSVLRLYDAVDTRVGGRLGAPRERRGGELLRGLLGRMESIDAVRKRELMLPTGLFGLLNQAADRLGSRVLLIAGWEGRDDILEARVQAGRLILAAGEDLGAAPGEDWLAHRHDVSYKLSPVFCRGGFADTMEVAAPWSRLESLYRSVRAALSEHAVVMAHFSHAYPEGCSIYFSFVGTGSVDRYDRAWTAALEAARAAGGTITHHHGVGALKAKAATTEVGHAIRVYRSRKERLDPGGILNPGRLFTNTPPFDQGPPPPVGQGPVFLLDRASTLASVDPWAAPEALQMGLAALGFRMRLPPDRPLAPWLRAWSPLVHERHEIPFFGIQARFADGAAATLGLAPRSAAGPDLRWGLLVDAKPEMVQVPVAPLDRSEVQLRVDTPDPAQEARLLLQSGLRPHAISCTETVVTLTFCGPSALALGTAVKREAASRGRLVEEVPLEAPSAVKPDYRIDANGVHGATSHHRLAEVDSEAAHG